jgi:hypothetical protein
MNNNRQDNLWQNLLAQSAPTFAGETEPPYGFITGALAQLRAEQGQQKEIERIGWRALWASVAALTVVATFTLGVQLQDRNDLEPGINSVIVLDHIQLS